MAQECLTTARAYSAAALPVPVLVGVVGVADVPPKRFPTVLPTVDTVFPAVLPTVETVFPSVDVTPERSPALADAMPRSTQTTTTRRCIFQAQCWKASDPNVPTRLVFAELCVPLGCLALF